VRKQPRSYAHTLSKAVQSALQLACCRQYEPATLLTQVPAVVIKACSIAIRTAAFRQQIHELFDGYYVTAERMRTAKQLQQEAAELRFKALIIIAVSIDI
jgi:hypothetical protein